MARSLKRVLADLREDHRTMRSLLDLLELETGRLGHGDEPDFDRLLDVMKYMIVYADAVHHPKEDSVYSQVCAVSSEFGANVDSIDEDHRDIAELGEKLRNDVAAIICGVAVRRTEVVIDARAYAARMREHMAWEEQALFPKADELADRHDIALTGSLFDQGDPAFGATRMASFDNLLKSIQQTIQQQ